MIPPAVLMKLATLGLPADKAGMVAEMLAEVESATKAEAEAGVEKGREKARARWRKWKDSQDANVGKRSPTPTNDSREGVTRVEDNLQTKNQSGEEGRKKEGAPAAPTPLSHLSAVLDDERARAVIDHRQRLKKPLTAHAAKLLAAKLAIWPDANAAADLMIEKGWQSFEPSWAESNRAPLPAKRATAPPRERTVSDVLGEIAAGTWMPSRTEYHEPEYPPIGISSRN